MDELRQRRTLTAPFLTSNQDTQKTLTIPSKAVHDLRSRLMPASAMKKLKEDEVRLLGHFVDLLERMLSLEGAKRPTPKVSESAHWMEEARLTLLGMYRNFSTTLFSSR